MWIEVAAIVFGLAMGLSGSDPALAEELRRLEGQEVVISQSGDTTIADIAGEGPPRVGVVERRGDALWLSAESGESLRLTGPLAVPRIAGPGYKIWVLGERAGNTLAARRLGVLRPPRR